MSLEQSLFTSFDTTSFDTASEQAAQSTQRTKQRRASWPTVKFRKNEKTGNEEMLVRILPIAPVKVAGAWCRGKGKSGTINLYLDSSAWNPTTQTFNGPDPVQELGISKPSFKYIVYCIDINHLGTLNKLGVASDRYAPYEEGAEMTWHPYRVLEVSNTLMGQINNIRAMRGSASDPATGYILSIVRSNASNKVSYQVIPGDGAFPIGDSVLQDLARLSMPDIRQYHEPSPLHEQLKTLLFCGCTSYDKAIQLLESYHAAGAVKQEDYAVTLKGMTTYASARGLIGEGGAATLAAPGLPVPGTLAAPGLPAPGLAAPGLPAVGLPSVPAVPAVPALPAAVDAPVIAAPALPAVPAIPAAPALPSLPTMAAPALPGLPPAPPALPGLPTGVPGLPSLPGLPVPNTGMLQ
jgi:hypothetical protein